ncbi:MAG: hypothetical protein IAE79_05790 [Anaerolinea sp.]|nr:hypothetical protein [Anaerolinea sp.]
MDELFETLVQEACRIRYAVYKAGGMATKSGVEDALMYFHGIERDMAHDVMNHIEYNALDSFREWRGTGDEPKLSDYPEIALIGRTREIGIRGKWQDEESVMWKDKRWIVEIGGYLVMTPQCAVERDGSVWANIRIGQGGHMLGFSHRIEVTETGAIKFDLNNKKPFLGKYGQPKMTDDEFVEFVTNHIDEIVAHIRLLCMEVVA